MYGYRGYFNCMDALRAANDRINSLDHGKVIWATTHPDKARGWLKAYLIRKRAMHPENLPRLEELQWTKGRGVRMTNDSDLLAGQVALITGAGRGLGREIALTFARAGADIVATARTKAQVEDTTRELKALGRRALPIVTDVRQEDQVRVMADQALKAFGQVDILVNNAGMSVYGSFVEQKAADWRAMIETNLMGTIFCTHAILPSMLERGQGLIINISSVAGIHGLPNEAVYCASKHGVKGLTDALAIELKDKGIRVCGVYPGGMNTPFWDVQTYHGDRSRIMDPAKVAAIVLAVAVQPQGTLVREVILFPTNEWH